jgi:hypothetical protein
VNGGASWDWMRPAVEMAATADDPGYTEYARIATRTLSLEHVSVRRARDFTVATLRRWGLAELADDMTIVVSELLTNALRHASQECHTSHENHASQNGHAGQDGGTIPGRRIGGWPIRFGLLSPGGCVLCAVADPSPEMPVMRQPDFLAETGRGLHVVASLSDDWGWTAPGRDGKVVWARFLPQWVDGADAQAPHAVGRAVGSLGGDAGGAAVGFLRA